MLEGVYGAGRNPRVTVVLPEELLKRARAHANEVCIPLSTMVRVALGEYMRRNEKSEQKEMSGEY